MSQAPQLVVGEPLLLRADEAASLLAIGRTKVFEMMAAGELPVIRIGRCVRIPKDQLERWIGDQARETTGGGRLQRGLTPARGRLIFRTK